MAKLQSAEKTLAALGDQEESLELIWAKIKEVRKRAKGGEDQSRAEKAQSFLAQGQQGQQEK
eukprot:6411576-Heterocapsa_arctica.AAC.1